MRLLLTVLLLTSPILVVAQRPAEIPPQRPISPDSRVRDQAAALARLDFMLGTWRGPGWMILGPGHRAEFDQIEIVQKKLDGTLITIDGDGRDAADHERHIHSAFATITFMTTTGSFRFMPFSGGSMLDVTPVVAGKIFTWGFDAPYGKTRFTLDFSTGDWHEVGEISRDGGLTWTKNFEMILTRSN